MNIKDLMERYKITRPAVLHCIKKNIEIINFDGVEHAKQTADGWQFDAEAVKIIDELRGFSQVAIIENFESETVKELQAENENLRQLLLLAQSKLIKVQENLNAKQDTLLESEKKFVENDMNVVRLQADLKIEKSKREIAEDKISEIKSQLEKIKNRGLIDRIFNKF